ncbi:MAG: hypothetical protein ACOH13_07940 [Flavobacteriales bacterium]
MKKYLLISAFTFPILVFGQSKENDPFRKYDERGNLIEYILFNHVGEVAETSYMEYDSLDRLTKNYNIDAGSTDKEWINIYLYNDQNLVTRRNWYPSDKMILYKYETYKYDDAGNRIERLEYSTDIGLVFKETWEYDAYNLLRVHKEEYLQYEGDRIIDKE